MERTEQDGEMRRYRYVGPDTSILTTGVTALGRQVGGKFLVQTNPLNHPWAHSWNKTDRILWKLLDSTE